jgi:hypothetical protein
MFSAGSRTSSAIHRVEAESITRVRARTVEAEAPSDLSAAAVSVPLRLTQPPLWQFASVCRRAPTDRIMSSFFLARTRVAFLDLSE